MASCYSTRLSYPSLAEVRSPTSGFRALHGAPPVGLRTEPISKTVMGFQTLRELQFDVLQSRKSKFLLGNFEY